MKSVKCTPTSESKWSNLCAKIYNWNGNTDDRSHVNSQVSLYTKFFFNLMKSVVTLLDRYCSQAKQVHVKLDDRNISPPEGFLLRKGEPIV